MVCIRNATLLKVKWLKDLMVKYPLFPHFFLPAFTFPISVPQPSRETFGGNLDPGLMKYGCDSKILPRKRTRTDAKSPIRDCSLITFARAAPRTVR